MGAQHPLLALWYRVIKIIITKEKKFFSKTYRDILKQGNEIQKPINNMLVRVPDNKCKIIHKNTSYSSNSFAISLYSCSIASSFAVYGQNTLWNVRQLWSFYTRNGQYIRNHFWKYRMWEILQLPFNKEIFLTILLSLERKQFKHKRTHSSLPKRNTKQFQSS